MEDLMEDSMVFLAKEETGGAVLSGARNAVSSVGRGGLDELGESRRKSSLNDGTGEHDGELSGEGM